MRILSLLGPGVYRLEGGEWEIQNFFRKFWSLSQSQQRNKSKLDQSSSSDAYSSMKYELTVRAWEVTGLTTMRVMQHANKCSRTRHNMVHTENMMITSEYKRWEWNRMSTKISNVDNRMKWTNKLSTQSSNKNYWGNCSEVEWTSDSRWRLSDLVDQFTLLPNGYVWLEGLWLNTEDKLCSPYSPTTQSWSDSGWLHSW